jgi:hypothetical protein
VTWVFLAFTVFFAFSALMNALDDEIRGFYVHGWIAFVLLIITIVSLFFHKP